MNTLRYPIIAGPTASGKTAVAVMLAKRIGGEVVSADSMQIYADISIGTARPSDDEIQGVPHHLQGFLPLQEKYSVARYVTDANAVFEDIFRRDATPILCGGTGLYIQSFMENRQLLPQPTDAAYREQLKAQADEFGGEYLLEQLRRVDPLAASRLHPNDHHRIIRALEVFHTSGQTISQQNEQSLSNPSPYYGCLFVLGFRDRNRLYERIEQRVDAMLRDGILDEARRMLQLNADATAMQAIGYKELLPFLRGECSLDDAIEKLKMETRRYAKRQMSWFRRMGDAIPVYVDEYTDLNDLVDDIENQFRNFCRKG